jgi:hypothetical protein
LSNVYEDGTPISISRSHNSFLKKKNSTYTNTTVVHIAPNDILDSVHVEGDGNNIVNKIIIHENDVNMNKV